MVNRSLGALIALNVVLVVALAVVHLTSPPVNAQAFGGAGDYAMLAGSVKGRTQQDIVYIVELTTARMVAVMFNSNTNELEVLAARDVTRDTQAGGDR